MDSTLAAIELTGSVDEHQLRVSSTLQLQRLLTVNMGVIRRELGCLSPRLRCEVESRLRLLFGLDQKTPRPTGLPA